MLDQIKELREKTGAGVMDAKKAIEEASGDMKKAVELIRAKGLARAEAKAEREVKSGRVYCYTHAGGTAAAMVEVACETDFVAKTEEFDALCKEIAMQIVSMNPTDVDELMAQPYIRDGSKTIEQLVKELVSKTGENIRIVRLARFKLGVE
ncbi:translation elongation factor Ts [Patescibacteria group bacterium]|nr:translation elongation factor Ts [Patescibacteria group bacterium]